MGIRNTDVDAWTPVDTDAILVNVIWIVEQLDTTGLAEIGDVPVLELAKHISIGRHAA